MNLNEFSVKQFYENPFLKWYRQARFKLAVKMADLKAGEMVLDFGCYKRELKQFLPSINKFSYLGYDIIPAYSDYSKLSDYADYKPTVVFALATFEHLTEKELDSTLRQLKRMGIKKIVAEYPYQDSIFNRFGCWILQINFEQEMTHKLTWQQITKIMDRYFDCTAYKGLYWLTWISTWEAKK